MCTFVTRIVTLWRTKKTMYEFLNQLITETCKTSQIFCNATTFIEKRGKAEGLHKYVAI